MDPESVFTGFFAGYPGRARGMLNIGGRHYQPRHRAPMKFNLNNAEFVYEPYPICYIPNFLDADVYAELAETYPDRGLFVETKNIGNKYSLSELNNPDKYYDFLDRTPCWKRVYECIKSPEFVTEIAEFLKERNIDLRLDKFKYTRSLRYRRRGPIRRAFDTTLLRSRFEFSAMSANQGNILPHTDAPTKVITLVVSFIKDGEWNADAWGGGTSLVMPTDRTRIYNQFNKYMDFDEVDVVKTFPFNPNQCVLFVKTYNSWHSVQPMTGPEEALRKTLTVNIESIP